MGSLVVIHSASHCLLLIFISFFFFVCFLQPASNQLDKPSLRCRSFDDKIRCLAVVAQSGRLNYFFVNRICLYVVFSTRETLRAVFFFLIISFAKQPPDLCKSIFVNEL